jgi:hypothetical protein
MKQYGKLTAENLKIVLSFLPFMSEIKHEVEKLLLKEQSQATSNISILPWSFAYELTFSEHLALVLIDLGLADYVKQFTARENPTQAFFNEAFTEGSAMLPAGEPLEKLPSIMSLYFSMQSLLTYGLYVNDLIAIARGNHDKNGTVALFNAIRVDPTVIGCPTAISYISNATVLNDQDFFKKLKNAISGKLGKREAKNYQQMRFILQVLSETGADNLSDEDLKELFVSQLDIYSDSQHSAQKNINEFTRNFIKQKSTI